MRIGIFYLSTDPATVPGARGTRTPLLLPGGGQAWVRVEETEAEDELAALDMAQPVEGESLMNTHALGGESKPNRNRHAN